MKISISYYITWTAEAEGGAQWEWQDEDQEVLLRVMLRSIYWKDYKQKLLSL